MNTYRTLSRISQPFSQPLARLYLQRAPASSFFTSTRLRNQTHNPDPQPSTPKEPQTHFGFRDVPESLKEKMVGQVFANVASKYDVMNDFMSGGVHRLWKDHFIRSMAPGPGTKLLDVAGGTGDIALRFLDYCHRIHGDATAQVQIVDINSSMLEVSFLVQNAEHLDDVPSDSVDVYTIAFGIRNCTHVDRVLREAHRVLRKGGRFMCLEFGKVENPVVEKIYSLYSFEVIPTIGQLVANDRDSYQYLVESIRKFPPQSVFADMIRDAGFTTVGRGWEDLTFGVAAVHSGFKL